MVAAGHGRIIAVKVGGNFQQHVPGFKKISLGDLWGSEHRVSV